ncbi:L,D-transpeptidase family protein [uncultured Zoogloea sp.]|uniref:L,D-transpeptidase family protein n=1 Tax=uncultured Zoogloea sp. TaxID=160237 RepID=UPI002612EFFF|nr:L,D-transpeptidase family protein [uncultured Zoogloea sp.]
MVAPYVIPPASTQLLLCIASDWDSPAGELQCFTRNADGNWQPDGQPLPVMLGRSGLAWGRGLHPLMAGTAKQEGDGRAPAGVFAITALFGYAPADAPLPRAARLPYHPARPGLKCVDDPKSSHYNCIVDAAGVPGDWASCEDMLRDDRRYELGAVVAHNMNPPVPGAGSCIFLHVWETPETPTSGCTAMALAPMQEIARWLDAARAPVLVQLPESEYARHQQAWGLPRR